MSHGPEIIDASPIPTPWRVRWNAARARWAPVVAVGVCAMLSVWLWSRHVSVGTNAGEVEKLNVVVTSVVDGRLAYVGGHQVALYDNVEEGDVIARIDDTGIRSQIAARQAELKLLKDQLGAAESTATPADAPASATSTTAVAAFRMAVSAKEEQLAQLDLKLDSLELRAPISGTVKEIHRRPGEFVLAGHPLIEIAAQRGARIVSYIRTDQRVMPRPGMAVEVRLASDPRHALEAAVESVGVQFESIPNRQLRDPKVPEWGIPVHVTVPAGVELRPGELVRLSFEPRPAGAAANVHVAQANPASVATEPTRR